MIGHDVTKAGSAQECMEIAGLNYKLHTERIYIAGQNLVDGIPVIGKEVPKNFAVVREDTRQPIAIVGEQYHIAQNAVVFGFVDGIVEQGLGKFKRAYSTHNGGRVFLEMDFGDQKFGGDISSKKFTLRTSHDGTSKITGSFLVWRQICSNGLMGWGNEVAFAIKHTKSYTEKLQEAKKICGFADQYYRWFAQEADRMVNMPLTAIEAKELIKQLVPAVDEKNVTARVTNQREKIYEYFRKGDGNHGRNRWDLYNGLTQYVDHWRSRNRDEEVAVETNLTGSGAKLKKDALKLLTK